jgi:hypothetical protein
MTNNAILTKDNSQKKEMAGDPSCGFFDCVEIVSHLFFECPVVKEIWLVVAKCFGASNIPTDLQQCWQWCE